MGGESEGYVGAEMLVWEKVRDRCGDARVDLSTVGRLVLQRRMKSIWLKEKMVVTA